jgi:hypothetical protein
MTDGFTVNLEALLKAILVPSTIKRLYQQTKKAQTERSNRIPEGEKKSQRDWSTSLKQARAPGHRNCRAKLKVYQG